MSTLEDKFGKDGDDPRHLLDEESEIVGVKLDAIQKQYKLDKYSMKMFYKNTELVLDEVVSILQLPSNAYLAVGALWATIQSMYIDSLIDECNAAHNKLLKKNPNAGWENIRVNISPLSSKEANVVAQAYVKHYGLKEMKYGMPKGLCGKGDSDVSNT